MDTKELEGLLKELIQGITQVVESGEVLSDEFQGILAQTLSAHNPRLTMYPTVAR